MVIYIINQICKKYFILIYVVKKINDDKNFISKMMNVKIDLY